jgi:hypothetical protein
MLELALRAFLTLLVVVDPVGIAPVYLGLVAARPRAEQASLTILVGHAGPDPLDRAVSVHPPSHRRRIAPCRAGPGRPRGSPL